MAACTWSGGIAPSTPSPRARRRRQRRPSTSINVSVSRGVVTASGPSSGRWVVLPDRQGADARGPHLEDDQRAHQRRRRLRFRVNARTTNGPIGLKDSGGRIDARAQNGPVSFAGRGGEVSLTREWTDQRPLDGDRWQDGSLAARPKTVPCTSRGGELPVGRAVESSGHSPWSCKGEACRAGRKDWDDRGRSVELGTGPTVVRISTVNGPVAHLVGVGRRTLRRH